MSDEAVEVMEDAMRGIDEEITYTMEMILMQQKNDDDKTTACDEYDAMFAARPALLEVPSGRGTIVQAICRTHRGGNNLKSNTTC